MSLANIALQHINGQYLSNNKWGYNFIIFQGKQQTTNAIFFSYFPENKIWHFMQIVAWNVKPYFLEKQNKKNISK